MSQFPTIRQSVNVSMIFSQKNTYVLFKNISFCKPFLSCVETNLVAFGGHEI